MRKIWTEFEARTSEYVGRCSFCGKYKNKKNNNLYTHWFFNGVYCITCIHDVLYDNCRTIKEIQGES